jgi:4-amino-4-deoxy-L-arabinose transferase-like glycosyltransferase
MLRYKDAMSKKLSTAVGLAVLVAAGTWVRARDIGEKSMSHPEMWVPLIPLSEDIADPPARSKLYEVLNWNLGRDLHPPAYYLMMWVSGQFFGTSIWALRIPALLFGVASIPLLYWLGALAGRPAAGWIGTVLLAFNGYHIAWSGFARMYSMACFLGLLSSALLLLALKDVAIARTARGLYVVVTLLALSTHIFLWPLVVVHIVWLTWNAWQQRRPIPALWNGQVLVVLAATPLLAFAAFQSHHYGTTLQARFWLFAREFFQFGFLLPLDPFTDLFAQTPTAAFLTFWGSGFSVARAILLGAGLVILYVGLRSVRAHAEQMPPQPASGPWLRLWIVVAALAALISAAFVWSVRRHPTEIQGSKLAVILPFLLAALSVALHRVWPRLPQPRTDRSVSALAALAIGPIVVVAMFSLARPALTQRGLLVASPYLLLALALGLEVVGRRWFPAAVVGLALLVAHFHSVEAYRHMTVDPADFGAFSRAVRPHIQEDDLIFIERTWLGTPLLYYLRPPQYRIIAGDYAEALRRNPQARVWWLNAYEEQGVPPKIRSALYAYREQRLAVKGQAILYSRTP